MLTMHADKKASLTAATVLLALGLLAPGCAADAGGNMIEGDFAREPGAAAASDSGANGQGDEELEAGQMTAGEWRDLEHWGMWRELMGEAETEREETFENHADTWGYHTLDRVAVEVVGSNGAPAVDAHVELRDAEREVVWTARTDNRGRAELFAGMWGSTPSGPFTVVAQGPGARHTVDEISPGGEGRHVVELGEAAPEASSRVDLMFVVDTTGSMADELEYLKTELRDVVERVRDRQGQELDIRVSVNFYRDHGDDYVIRDFPFTSDLATIESQIEQQAAGGGGDFPEAVDEALVDGIDDHRWSESARARMLFLVLDAPPHGAPQHLERMRHATRRAAELGVRIVPVSASGIDRSTEFLMRFLGIATGSTYTFITNHSGIGDDHLEPTVGEYEVEYLNNMLVRLIDEATTVAPAAGQP
jgi:Mg-chelatase subunit ChlD